MKIMAFISGMICVTLIGYLFMDGQTKSQIGQAGHSLIEQGKQLTGKVKDDISSAGTATKESLAGTPEDSMKSEADPAETMGAETKPARVWKGTVAGKEPVEAFVGADDDESRPRTARMKDNDAMDTLEQAQAILMDAGRQK
jgi:hypothetical protein